MDSNRFARVTGAIESGSRRGFVAALAGGSLAALGQADTGARKKGRKKKNKKKGPSLALAYECPGPPEDVGTYLSVSRVAQVFAAARSGTLRRIEFRIENGDTDSGDYVVQLLRVDGGTPLPGATQLLASIAIPESDVPVGESTLTANFNGPELEAGMEYAAAIGRLVSPVRLGFFSGTGNVCAGQTFGHQGATFTEATGQDLVVSVFVD
jgi:hypothetical protein